MDRKQVFALLKRADYSAPRRKHAEEIQAINAKHGDQQPSQALCDDMYAAMDRLDAELDKLE